MPLRSLSLQTFPALFLLFFCTRESNAQWVPNGTLLSGAGGGSYVGICPDGASGAFVGWSGNIYPQELDFNIRYQHLLPTGELAPGFPADGLRACAPVDDQYLSQAIPDGTGGWFLIWIDFRTFNQTGYDIYAQRIMPDGSVAPGWPADGAPVSASAGNQSLACGIADGTGGLLVVWADSRANTNDVYLNRLTSTGQVAAGFPANGRPVVNSPGVRYFDGFCVPDGQGGGLVEWYTTQGATTYVLRITPDGNAWPGWPAGGVVAATQRGPHGVAPDGLGGAYVGLNTGNGLGDDANYYLQHVTAAGVVDPAWAVGGNVVCAAPRFRFGMIVDSDGVGGAIMQWQDSRIPGGFEYLYASRMQSNGTRPPGWPADGVRVTSLESFQTVRSTQADGGGGAYFVFGTDRPTDTSFIQHLRADGTVATGWPATGLQLGPFAQSPRLTTDGANGTIVAWYENHNYGVYAQRYVFDGIVATQLSLASADPAPDHVALMWQGPGASSIEATVYRRDESSEWQRLGGAEHDGADRLRYEDRLVVPGSRYAYRLGYVENGTERFTSENWVDVPGASAVLALEGLRPNPAVDALNVSFSLPGASTASVELLDVTGRRVLDREVGSLGAGRHLVRLDNGSPVAPGMYWLRLRQGERSLMARAVVVR